MSSQQPYDYYNPPSSQEPIVPQPVPVTDTNRGVALAGLILGIFGLIAWFLPLLGFPVTIVAVILSALGRRSVSRRTMATTALVIAIIGLVLTIINSAAGAYIYSHP